MYIGLNPPPPFSLLRRPAILQRSSADGQQEFVLHSVAHGLCLERVVRDAEGPFQELTQVFQTVEAWHRWCDLEPLRFEEPALLLELRRLGTRLFDGHV